MRLTRFYENGPNLLDAFLFYSVYRGSEWGGGGGGGGGGWGGGGGEREVSACWLSVKFHSFVNCRLKFSTFFGCR